MRFLAFFVVNVLNYSEMILSPAFAQCSATIESLAFFSQILGIHTMNGNGHRLNFIELEME